MNLWVWLLLLKFKVLLWYLLHLQLNILLLWLRLWISCRLRILLNLLLLIDLIHIVLLSHFRLNLLKLQMAQHLLLRYLWKWALHLNVLRLGGRWLESWWFCYTFKLICLTCTHVHLSITVHIRVNGILDNMKLTHWQWSSLLRNIKKRISSRILWVIKLWRLMALEGVLLRVSIASSGLFLLYALSCLLSWLLLKILGCDLLLLSGLCNWSWKRVLWIHQILSKVCAYILWLLLRL